MFSTGILNLASPIPPNSARSIVRIKCFVFAGGTENSSRCVTSVPGAMSSIPVREPTGSATARGSASVARKLTTTVNIQHVPFFHSEEAAAQCAFAARPRRHSPRTDRENGDGDLRLVRGRGHPRAHRGEWLHRPVRAGHVRAIL